MPHTPFIFQFLLFNWLMASQRVASNEVVMLIRALEILHAGLRIRESRIPCLWRLQQFLPVDFYEFNNF
jgi:hypothetical protein